MEEPIAPHRQLKQAREKRGWTQARVAELIGVDTGTVSRWECAEAKPRPWQRTKLAKLFQIPIDAWAVQDEEINVSQEEPLLRPLSDDELPYPKIWTIPFNVSFFVGRQDVLHRLHQALVAGNTTALTQTISGLGGIGKTVTAAKYAYVNRGQYKAVFWIEANTREKLISGLLRMAQHLNLPERRLKDPERVLAAVKRWMKEQTHWLLILDNVEQVALLHELLPNTRRGHVLLTTRTQSGGQGMVTLELNGLSQEDGALLLLRRAGRLAEAAQLEEATEQERALAKDLSFQMEGLPLALEQAGAFIREQDCSLAEYLEWYKTRRAYLLRWRSPQSLDDPYAYPHSVATTWSLSFEKIRESSLAAVDLLSFYAFLDPETIPEELVIIAKSELGPHLGYISDQFELLAVLAQLRKYSFLHRDGDQHTVNIHRLVQAVFKDNMDDEMQRQWAERTVRAMHKTFIGLKDKPLQEQDRYFPHAQRCYDWITQWSFHFSEAAHLLLLLGNYAQKRFFYSLAEEYFLQAIAIIEAIRASGHTERAVFYNNTAAFYEETEKYELAEAYLRKALLIFEKSSVPERDLFLARTLSNAAGVLEKRNKLVEAEQLARRAVEILEQGENVDDLDMVYALNTYEVILFGLKKNEEAKQVTDRINRLFHPQQASNLERAQMLESQGEKETPMRIDLIEQALELFRREYGPEHREIAHCLSALGAGYMEREEYIRAQSYYQQALEMYKSIKNAEHSDVVMILAHLGICSFYLKQRKEAGAFLEQAQKLAEKNPSPYVSRQMMEMLNQVLKAFPQEEDS